MNTKEYIRSGIIESYVLGIATEAEREEFESMCSMYPEVAEARDSFERALEEKMMQDAKQPPALLKQKIEERLTATPQEIIEEEEEKNLAPVGRMNVWKLIAAAAIILLAGSAYWAYTTNNKYQDLLSENQSLKDQVSNSSEDMKGVMEDFQTLQHPMKVASLKGTDIAPKAYATVYWDTAQTKNVYLLINNLPEPPTDKQYQLWALLDGKPIDLGVFDMDIKQRRLLVKMQNVQKAQAFAITLEPKGGSVNPTMNSMYVEGNL